MTTALEDALQSWVVTSSKLAGDHVIWGNQDVTRPSDAFILLTFAQQDTDGAFDQIEDFTDLTRQPGQEVELRVTGWREFTLTVEAFSHVVSGDGSAFDMLTTVQTALALPSIRDLLNVAGLGPSFDRGTIQNIPKLLGTSRFESRATVTMSFYRSVNASDFTGYIAEANATGNLQGSVNLQTGTVDIAITSG